MSFTYFRFLFTNTIRKKSVWIVWLLFLFTCVAFIILLPWLATMNTLQVWANTTMSICQTFMGMVAGLFTAVLAINIFKETNEEGTELIVISKPISRFKIVVSKFILFGAFCLLVNISTVILTAFTAFLPRTEMQFYVGLLVSMFIGNAITFALFGSISIILTINFAKVGIIITNIIISLAFLIYQALTLFVFSTPLTELSNQSMSASSYILHERNTQTGEYVEKEIVSFTGSAVDEDKQHPCQAKNWKEMKNYWEQNILGKDPSTILNATDWASQLALTYMSYNTDQYAYRQANRMFAFTRYYNYKLTSPASPELTEEIEGKQSLPWIYYSIQAFPILSTSPLIQNLLLPASIGFDGIPPLTGTRLRGYTDLIPIGSVSSKEILSSKEIFFEKEQWQKYAPKFDSMAEYVFDYRNYDVDLDNLPLDKTLADLSWAFAWSSSNLSKYYENVWRYFTGNLDDSISPYNTTSFDINTINDLNERFMQFKNYMFWKIYEKQQKYFNYQYEQSDYEAEARQEVLESIVEIEGLPYPMTYKSFFEDILLAKIEDNNWMLKSISGLIPSLLLDENTKAPNTPLMAQTWFMENQKLEDDTILTDEQKAETALNSAWSVYLQTSKIFTEVVNQDEQYLFTSLTEPTRSWNYSGSAYFGTGNWYPNMYQISSLLGTEINLPLGQNMQWFYYETSPKLKYWIFTIIWGSISLGLFATGIVLYNKYDVK